MRQKARSCRQRSKNHKFCGFGNESRITRFVSLRKSDAVPGLKTADPVSGFPWPPPLLAELREIFRPPFTLVKPPKKPEVT